MQRKYADRLLEAAQNADELPEEVEGAINDVLDHADVPVQWYKAPFFKNGQFSKTATFATVANIMVLAFYALSFFQGLTIGRGELTWTLQPFDVEAAVAILTIVNGTYLGNNFVKKGK